MSESANEMDDDGIREIYQEYEDDEGTVAIISDPENHHAWLQSTLTHPIER